MGLLVVSIFIPTSFAQYRFFTNILPEEITPGDFDYMKEAAREKMQDQPVDTVITWKNPESGNTGAVKLLRRFNLQDRECMKNRHYVLYASGEREIFEFTVCREEGGEWVFVS